MPTHHDIHHKNPFKTVHENPDVAYDLSVLFLFFVLFCLVVGFFPLFYDVNTIQCHFTATPIAIVILNTAKCFFCITYGNCQFWHSIYLLYKETETPISPNSVIFHHAIPLAIFQSMGTRIILIVASFKRSLFIEMIILTVITMYLSISGLEFQNKIKKFYTQRLLSLLLLLLFLLWLPLPSLSIFSL